MDKFSLTTYPFITKNTTPIFLNTLTPFHSALGYNNIKNKTIGLTPFHLTLADYKPLSSLRPWGIKSKFTSFLLFLSLSKQLNFLIPGSKSLNTYLLNTYDINSKRLIRLDNEALFFNLKSFSNKSSLSLSFKKQLLFNKQLTSYLNENNLEFLLDTYVEYNFKSFK